MTPRPAALLGPLALLAACAALPPPPPPGAPGPAGDPARATTPPGPAEAGPPVLDLSGVASPPLPPEARGTLPPGEQDPVVARVDGSPIRASDLARHLFRVFPERALDALNQVLDARVLEADAAARGVTIPAGEVEGRTEAEFRSRETEIRVQMGPGATLEGYLRERFGMGVEAYRAELGSLMRLLALRDRLVRYEAMREDRLRIRVLVLRDEAAAREAARRLEAGADFEALARQVSVVPPEDLPSYPRDEIHPPALADLLFALPEGGVSRPVRVARDGRELFEVFRVIEVRRGREVPYAAAAEEIERGLRERPVRPAEYLQWARRARARHGVEVLLEDRAAEGAR